MLIFNGSCIKSNKRIDHSEYLFEAKECQNKDKIIKGEIVYAEI
jgi:hypothetical protein